MRSPEAESMTLTEYMVDRAWAEMDRLDLMHTSDDGCDVAGQATREDARRILLAALTAGDTLADATADDISVEHKGRVASSALAPGSYAYCSCGWTSGPLAYSIAECERRLKEHQAAAVARPKGEAERLAADLESARWTIDQIRKRVIAAMNGDFTALLDELDRLCLSEQQMRSGDITTETGGG